MSEPLCPEHDKRAAMSDADFWEHVYPQHMTEENFDDPEAEEPTPDQSCEICGERGPCGYDAEGRPMIHATGGDDS